VRDRRFAPRTVIFLSSRIRVFVLASYIAELLIDTRPLSAASNDAIDPFSDMYQDGEPPAWPESFSDRLFVIKFDFVRNQTSGATVLGENNGFD
jgi:hypothetical protein